MPRKDIDYSRCIIYKIVCNDFNVKDLYVGHTTDLVKRRSLHKSICNNSNSKYHDTKIYTIVRENGGWENWSIVVIEIYSTCKDAEEARTRERYWFEKLNASLNSIRPITTHEEHKEIKRQYYEDNKEKIKLHYLDNKDNIQEQHKKYYEINKENLLEQKKQYYIENKDIKKLYYLDNKEIKKLYYEENKEKLLEQMKQYREQNKEKRIEQAKQYYVKNLENSRKPFLCDCGSTIRTDSKSTHMKTRKHKEFRELKI